MESLLALPSLEASEALRSVQRPDLFVTVHGDPQPGGSKRGFANPRTGAIIITDANRKAKGWQRQVAQVVGEIFEGPLWDGPIRVEFVFYRPRPASHYGTGRNAGLLKASAPAYPTTRPDALKLARATEDALTGIVWRDDARIVDESLHKRWGDSRVEISAWLLG